MCTCETLLYVLVETRGHTVLCMCTVCFCMCFLPGSCKHRYHWDLTQFLKLTVFCFSFWQYSHSSISTVINILFLRRISVYQAEISDIMCCNNVSYIYDGYCQGFAHSIILKLWRKILPWNQQWAVKVLWKFQGLIYVSMFSTTNYELSMF